MFAIDFEEGPNNDSSTRGFRCVTRIINATSLGGE